MPVPSRDDADIRLGSGGPETQNPREGAQDLLRSSNILVPFGGGAELASQLVDSSEGARGIQVVVHGLKEDPFLLRGIERWVGTPRDGNRSRDVTRQFLSAGEV
jgi:hypothetical protein